jgi:8-oxo-dGTP pyrophosphatase MutT (NUDIX family)
MITQNSRLPRPGSGGQAKRKARNLKREFSAGGAVFRKLKTKNEKLKTEWLLIRPSGKKRWQLPKGLIDDGESSREAALREVKEEGGVETKVLEKIDTIKIFFHYHYEGASKELIFKTITFYLMEYLKKRKEGPDFEVERVSWLPFEEARETLTFLSEKKVLEKAKKILKGREKQPVLL